MALAHDTRNYFLLLHVQEVFSTFLYANWTTLFGRPVIENPRVKNTEQFCIVKKIRDNRFLKSAKWCKMAAPQGTWCLMELTTARDFNWTVALPYSDDNKAETKVH